ncbi:hypothetical protein [Streptomyces sp. bgisy034]|uniref:hypothetical protein n=1 Tax=Streptomyces sp. bgisy034 TaxID=3413774 RepID=UPI003EBF8686
MHDDTTFDSTLVNRLSRRALRPGVTDPGQARAALTRHGDMTAGLPLAELAARYVDPLPHDGATVPIVYARPAHAGHAGPSRPPATGAAAAVPGSSASTGSMPVASARPVTAPADGPALPAHPAARPGTDADTAASARASAGPGTGGSSARATVSPSVTGTPMIQRKVAAPQASRGRRAMRGGPVPPAPAADRAGPSAPSKPLAQGNGPVMAYLPSFPGRRSGAPVAFPAAAPSALAGADFGATAQVARPGPVGDPHPASPTLAAVPTVLAHPAPASYSGPMSYSGPAEAVAGRRPQVQPVRALPLATAGTASHDRSSPGVAAGRQTTGAPPQPVVPGAARTAPPGHNVPGGPEDSGNPAPRADRGTPQTPRPEAPQVDVAHITDQVHQRIVRRLAVEAERRGVRR